MSSKDLALEVDGVGKRYLISHQEKHGTLKSALASKLRTPLARPEREEFWALRDISFSVDKGEVLGLVGRNGAGKSTLLKILSQIVEPTEGEIRLYGRIGSLLEVGTGFHPELTGRENIFLNGTILGMRKREIERHFDEIVDFAEVERFLDTPVKRYSSGMYVRLAFAVAAHLNPEILVVDEVLAVGDAQFQAKCLGKMQDVSKQEGRTVVFVSHNMAAVRALCTKAVFLKGGRAEYCGDVDRALALYAEKHDFVGTIMERVQVVNEGIVLDRVTVNGSDATTVELASGETTLDVVVSGRAARDLRADVEFSLDDPQGFRLGIYGDSFVTRNTPLVKAGPFEWRARIDLPPNINQGDYVLSIDIAHQGVKWWLRIEDAVRIRCDGILSATGEPFPYKDRSGLVFFDGSVSRSSLLSERT